MIEKDLGLSSLGNRAGGKTHELMLTGARESSPREARVRGKRNGARKKGQQIGRGVSLNRLQFNQEALVLIHQMGGLWRDCTEILSLLGGGKEKN